MTYYSQYGQDNYLDSIIFKGIEDGYFIEFGAFDGVTHSNTLFFERTRNWKGICIEPKKDAFEKLTANRTAVCINGCVSDKSGQVEFLDIEGDSQELSGMICNYDLEHQQRIEKELAQSGGKANTVISHCYTLNQVFEQCNVTHLDYCSIDTEGGEINIIKSIDFDNYTIDVFSIENHSNKSRLRNFMYSIGYDVVNRLGVDDIYKRAEGNQHILFRKMSGAKLWIRLQWAKLTRTNNRWSCR